MGRRLFRGTRGKEADEDFDGVPDMTPARFDILFVVWRMKILSQRVLCKQLGLHPSTISDAVERLVELRLVKCARVSDSDRRTKGVRLTDEGWRRLKRALHLLFTERSISRHLRAFAAQHVGGARRGLAYRIDNWLGSMWHRLIDLARHLGSSAAIIYQLSCRT